VSPVPNPVRGIIHYVGLALARAGIVERERADRTTELAWPRVVTGLARMSKDAADVAMVGVGVGPTAIAGVGFAAPYWGAAFTVGGGIAAGTIALVSQRFGADAYDDLGQAVRSSVALVLAVTVPIGLGLGLFAEPLVGLLTDTESTVRLGAAYLEVVALGVPFAGLNLVGSRALIGADDAWTAMVVRGGGAIANIALNAVFIFGLEMGVVGAALGTVMANVLVLSSFVVGLVYGRIPFLAEFPVTVSPAGGYIDVPTMRDIASIGAPVVGRNLVWTLARFPLLYIVGLFGPTVVAAYVVSRRVWALMNTPGWGFGLAASSLVGQALGENDEASAAAYGREVTAISVATYVVAAAIVAAFAEPIVRLFVNDPTGATVAVAVGLVYAACVAVIPQGVAGTAAGALDATGDTRWPFYSRAVGMFGLAIPVAYLGATTSLGIWGLYLAYMGQTLLPAAVNYYRFSTGRWRAISREYRPDVAD
jgi:putative MATE family efflux protein